MLKEKIAAVEAQMKAKLEEARATFDHPGDKGISVEHSFRLFLRDYLPRRLEVGHGEIIDTKGRKSKQTDVVIVSEDHPFTFTPDLPGLFFVEGVCAASEVKAILTSGELQSALENSCQFKQLRMKPGTGNTICTNPSDLDRFYKSPPWFLVAHESQLDLAGVQKKIRQFGESDTVEVNRLADAQIPSFYASADLNKRKVTCSKATWNANDGGNLAHRLPARAFAVLQPRSRNATIRSKETKRCPRGL